MARDDVPQGADDGPQSGHEELGVSQGIAQAGLGVTNALEVDFETQGGDRLIMLAVYGPPAALGREVRKPRLARVPKCREQVLGFGETFMVLLGGQAGGSVGDEQEMAGKRPGRSRQGLCLE
jgi:hypothetical protein